MMGESSSCILRPMSQPASAALEANQGDHIRALTSSVSFGRYMSESLSWEKWSTFTRNQYKEEAERYAKPGSVAQMKAYFEAHYKKKAADRAAALLGQQNLVSETENQKLPVMEQDLVRKDRCVGTGETGVDVVTTQDVIVVPIEASRFPTSEKVRGAEDAQILNDGSSLLANPVDTTNQHNLVEDSQLCGSISNSKQKGQEDTHIVKAEEPLFANCEDVRDTVGDVKSLGTDAASEQSKMLIEAVEKLEDSGPLDKDKLTVLPTRLRPKPPVPPKPPVSIQKRKHNNAKLECKGTALDMEDKKRTMSRLLRFPRNFANETKKPRSPIIERILNSKVMKSLAGNASKVSRGKPVKDSVEKHPRAASTFQDRNVRHRSPLYQSISNSGNEETKSQSSFLGRSKSPGAPVREARPPVVARALSFKTEERAAKRKEFYERLEQKLKIKTKEKENLQEQTKDKARSDPKLKSESSRTSINVMKKVSAALPCSPSVGRKTPSTTLSCSASVSMRTLPKLQDNNSRSPWRLSTLAYSSNGGTKTTSELQDKIPRSPWKYTPQRTETTSELQDKIPRSPWKYTPQPCSSIVGTKTPSERQATISRSPWKSTKHSSSPSAGRVTPSKLQDNSRSPWRRTTLPSSSCVDRKTPSRVQDNSSRPPWRLTAKSQSCNETIEKNDKSPYHLARSASKKSTRENSSPNIQLSHET